MQHHAERAEKLPSCGTGALSEDIVCSNRSLRRRSPGKRRRLRSGGPPQSNFVPCFCTSEQSLLKMKGPSVYVNHVSSVYGVTGRSKEKEVAVVVVLLSLAHYAY